jgi:hypothetical protein
MICKKCKINKLESDFRINRGSYEKNCKSCRKNYKNENDPEWQQTFKIRRKKNIQKYHDTHKEQEQKYRINNKEQINKRVKNYKKSKLTKKCKNPVIKLRNNVSNLVRSYFKKNKTSKNGKSILNYLPYTIKQLKIYIESLFEPWMNWNNHGRYDVNTWNDNDSSTWKWQLDHIIPHSTFNYSSMEDKSFRDCWALSNLRPLSAKQNILDGTSKIRHKKEKE